MPLNNLPILLYQKHDVITNFRWLASYIATIINCQVNLEIRFFMKLGFTPCKVEGPLRDMELREKEAKKY